MRCPQAIARHAVSVYFAVLCLASAVSLATGQNLANDTPPAETLERLVLEELCSLENHDSKRDRLVAVYTAFHNGYGIEANLLDICKFVVGVSVCSRRVCIAPREFCAY